MGRLMASDGDPLSQVTIDSYQGRERKIVEHSSLSMERNVKQEVRVKWTQIDSIQVEETYLSVI